ncbi:MAG: RNA polymerase sigma factor [Candidatus Zixiibacteriota bacterium]
MKHDETSTTNDLVRRAKGGNQKAFSKLVREVMNPVLAHAYRMTGDTEAARDLAQDSFVAAWEHLHELKETARFKSWLFQIVSNRAINYLNRRSRQAQQLEALRLDGESVSSHSSAPPSELWSSRLKRGIRSFMATLPLQQRQVFDLHFYQGLTFVEIASVIGKAEGTVKTHYRQAVIKLRDLARKEGWHR